MATSAINHGYQIVRNDFHDVGGLTADNFACSRCIQYKGGIKCRQLTLYHAKTFHNYAMHSHGVTGNKWVAGV